MQFTLPYRLGYFTGKYIKQIRTAEQTDRQTDRQPTTKAGCKKSGNILEKLNEIYKKFYRFI
jgi:hypothetical protein